MLIPHRFEGPPGSANGGYVAGLLAAGRSMEVELRAPVPIDRPLQVERLGERVRLLDGDTVLAEGCPATPIQDGVPAPVSLAQAADASTRFPYALDGHAFPRCFGCGPERAEGDGLRIFAGPVEGRDDVYAAPWTPDDSLADGSGLVRPEFLWAALDCSGGCRVANPRSTPPVVLARLAAWLDRPVCAERPYVVVAWPLGRDGRKRHAGTALFTAEGELCAHARALWIELRGE